MTHLETSMTEIPQAAIDAAAEALDKRYRTIYNLSGFDREKSRPDIVTVLEAAAPLITSHRETATAQVIARAERERIRQLAVEHDAKAAKCSAGVAPQPSRPCACRSASPAFPFADLLTEG